MPKNYDATYWNNKGRHQRAATILGKRIPREGACPENRPCLEKYRQACNAYYDLYNNGGYNRPDDIRRLLNTSARSFNSRNDAIAQASVDAAERAMDAFVAKAWTEHIFDGEEV